MQQFDYNEVLETILAKDNRYTHEAYHFVREGLDFTQHKMAKMSGAKEPRHVTGRELTDGMRQFAIETYGPMAKLLLNPANAVPWDVRSVGAESFLVQELDLRQTTAVDLEIVTERHPSEDELKAMLFGWRAVKHVKSNAIVYAAKDRTLGVGAGQMSRVDASRIAVWKAGEAGLDLNGSVVCSDAFFPFADGLIAAAEAGATAAIQPGGSKRDDEVIAAANERSMAMAFTGGRHFRH